jgi:hypothetical protein
MALDRSQLLKMSYGQLDELFGKSPAGALPDGEGTGTAIVWSGTWCAHFFAWIARWFFWQGKVFDAKRGFLKNRVTAFGIRAIKATVAPGKSWFDQQDCTVIDYSKTSLLARMVRDEIREVAPGLYLGKVFLWGKPSIHFCVSFQYAPAPKFWRRVIATTALALLVGATYLAIRLNPRDLGTPVTYASDEDHFKYGSMGGEVEMGVPYVIWQTLPKMFRDLLPGEGLQSVGFIYEKDENGRDKDLPIGVSKRRVQGIDRVFLNCAACHVGTVRDTPESAPRIHVGMPANGMDLEKFERFLFACVTDERFTPERILPEMDRHGYREDALYRALIKFAAIDRMRSRTLLLRQRFLSFMDREPPTGPGRVDTFSPPKVLFNFPMEKLPEKEWIGTCDLPSIWNQRQREGMQLHWDGNNTSVEERNRSAAFGSGARPATLDRAAMKRTADWLRDKAKPAPFPADRIDAALAAKGQPLYERYCAACHGKSGTDFAGEYVGKVTDIARIGTDPHRLDSYRRELSANQNLLYAGYPEERFKHFRKTNGYANQPLDGVWLRAPYLHNGSVPTLRDLLEPSAQRPKTFYRGYDVYDFARVGFISNVPEEKGRKFFLYDTAVPGNGNAGHEDPADGTSSLPEPLRYGTNLPAAEKDAIVEYLKTF